MLDVGCGGGVFLRRALETGCVAVGLDHSRDMVRLAGETNADAVREGRLRVVHGSAEELPFTDGEFTAVSCIVAFFFFHDPIASCGSSVACSTRRAGGWRSSRRRRRRRGRPRRPYPLATRGHFYEDAELERLPLEAGFASAEVTRTDIGAQLLIARP